jgi:hypothetical protein
LPNPGKPAEVKRAIGSRAYKPVDSTIQLTPIGNVPEPSRPLGESGEVFWNRIWTTGQMWISPNTDIDLLLMTCEMFDERDLLRDYVLQNIDAWHERSALRELDKAISRNLSLLGFTPTDRMKLGVAEVKTKSKLEELLAKKAARG